MPIHPSLTNAFRADFEEHLPLTPTDVQRLRDGGPRDRWALADLIAVFAYGRPRRGVSWTQPEIADFRAIAVRLPPV
jgi:hypothetical protein